MVLWGKVARGLSLLGAAIFAAVAVTVPESRGEAALAAVLMTAVALIGVPAVVRLFSAFTGDVEVLQHGTPGSATITSLQATGWRYNRRYPIMRFALTVEAAGVYPVEIKQAVDPEVLARLAPGAVVAVRVDRADRKRVVIDWAQPIRGVADTPAGDHAAAGEGTTAPPRASRTGAWLSLRWIALVFGLVFLRLSCEAGYFETGGVRVQGVVIGKAYSPGTTATGSSRSSPARYDVSYRFTTRDGRTLEGRADVLPGTWRGLKPGDPVEIEYLSAAPETNRIPDQRAGARTWAIMAGVLLTATLVMFVLGWRERRKRPPQIGAQPP